MEIFFAAILTIALLIASSLLSELSQTVSRICLITSSALVLWISIGLSMHKQNKKFIKTIPVHIQDKIAFSVFEDKLINCSEKFNIQFNTSDSIYVYEEIDTWILGLKWSGGDYFYNFKKSPSE